MKRPRTTSLITPEPERVEPPQPKQSAVPNWRELAPVVAALIATLDTMEVCPKLSFEDAVNVKLRLMNREFYSRIAADFDVNQGRIADVKFGRLQPGSYEEALRRR